MSDLSRQLSTRRNLFKEPPEEHLGSKNSPKWRMLGRSLRTRSVA